jgi:superfamily II DNA or RNA helicase
LGGQIEGELTIEGIEGRLRNKDTIAPGYNPRRQRLKEHLHRPSAAETCCQRPGQMKKSKTHKQKPNNARIAPAPARKGRYFATLRASLNLYPPQLPAVRDAQRAALHAVGEHLYSHPKVSGLIVMPTGSGKSAVIVASPILAGAERVLVITPSRLVRQQLAQNFTRMLDPSRLGLIPKGTSEQVPRIVV